MATEEEVRLGRLAVMRGLATEEQVLDALRVRNRAESGDLGAMLAERGLVTQAVLEDLRAAAKRGEGAVAKNRLDASTELAVSLGNTREILARDQLEEALRAAPRDPGGALSELRRLAHDFRDTESGGRAAREAKARAAKRPGLDA